MRMNTHNLITRAQRNLRTVAVAAACLIASFGGNAMAESTPSPTTPNSLKTAIFAGGCFWCMQSEFAHRPGVISTTVGYSGGSVPNPTYEQVGTGKTGHREALMLTYNPAEVSYDDLLKIFWSNVDPLDATGQFCDQGPQYKSAVFYSAEAEKQAAEASKQKLAEKLGQPVMTDILPATPFYAAEAEHQNYSEKNPFKYKLYRGGCGRDGRLNELQKKMKTP